MGSMVKAKRAGESGHPCLVPLCKGKGMDSRPFSLMLAMGAIYNVRIQLIHFNGSPILRITSHRYAHSTLSNAFSISNVAIILVP